MALPEYKCDKTGRKEIRKKEAKTTAFPEKI